MFDIEPLHTGISVYDMAESIKWYDEILGFKLYYKQYHPELKCLKAFLKRKEFFIELFQYDNPVKLPEGRLLPNTDFQTVGTKHICFKVNNLTAVSDELKKKRADIVFVENVEGIPTCFIRDNSNVLIELMEWPK